eukprot:4969035-Prymnesium_polylepis.1
MRGICGCAHARRGLVVAGWVGVVMGRVGDVGRTRANPPSTPARKSARIVNPLSVARAPTPATDRRPESRPNYAATRITTLWRSMRSADALCVADE